MIFLCITTSLYAHCQIPCGIYDDHHRFAELKETIITLEKSMNQLHLPSVSDHQKTRWILNKEKHAESFTNILKDYFLSQRIKILADTASDKQRDAYINQIKLIHEMIVLSMKSKQTIDLNYPKKLRETLDAFESIYTH